MQFTQQTHIIYKGTMAKHTKITKPYYSLLCHFAPDQRQFRTAWHDLGVSFDQCVDDLTNRQSDASRPYIGVSDVVVLPGAFASAGELLDGWHHCVVDCLIDLANQTSVQQCLAGARNVVIALH
jgi:hypothetical protein